jgi:hypothetical protein
MRMFLMVVAMVAMPVWANAQQPVAKATGCCQDGVLDVNRGLRSARGYFVAVIDGESREWQGRLLAIDTDSFTVEVDARPRRFELTNVKRVDAHGDRIWDGAVKGALFGGIMAGIVGGGRMAIGSAVLYGLIGVGVDALNSCKHTVYRAPAVSASIKVLSW